MRKRLKLLLPVVACVAVSSWAAESDSIAPQELKEVVVKGDTRFQKNGYELLLLTKSERNFGTNALDAISSMNRFRTSLNATELTAWDQSKVFVLINGVPSEATDLRTFKGDDIKNIEYYQNAPPEYMSLTSGPLINVVMKKRHDRSFSGYFNAENAVNTGFGTNQADLTYADSLNQVKMGYYIDYRDVGKIASRSEYSYPPYWTSVYDNTEKLVGQYHVLSASYQHYRTNQLFNAKLSLKHSPSDEKSYGEYNSTTGDNQLAATTNNSFIKNRAKSATLDLYYNYVFKNQSSLLVNVVNTIGKSCSESYIDSPTGGAVNSKVDNDTYTFVASTFFSSRALAGNYTVGQRYEYSQLNQEFLGNTIKPYSHNEFIAASMSWIRNGMTLAPSLGLNVLSQSDGQLTKNSVSPYFRVYWDWWAKGALKGFSVQLTLSSRHRPPALSLLTDSYNFKDYHYVAIGNPNLKNYWDHTAKLALVYFRPDSRDFITLVSTTEYIDNAIASRLEAKDGEAFIKPVNLDHAFKQAFLLNITWYPVEWLEISPYAELYIDNYTASSKVRSAYFRYGASIAATLGNFTFSLHANSPTKEYDGDIITRGGMQLASILQYKYRNWSFAARYNHVGTNNRTIGKVGDFSIRENKDWKPLHEMFSFVATYSFRIGKSRTHRQVSSSEADADNGLNQYNQVARPR